MYLKSNVLNPYPSHFADARRRKKLNISELDFSSVLNATVCTESFFHFFFGGGEFRV